MVGSVKELSEQETPDTREAEPALARVIESERRYVAEALRLRS